MSKSNKPESRDAMDAVRELLFGQKAEEIESHFHDQESKFTSALDASEERLNERIQSFEEFMRNEIDSINGKIKANAELASKEKKATAKAIAELSGRVDDDFEKVRLEATENTERSRNDLYSRASEIEEKLSKAVRVLKEHALTEVNGLRETAADRQRIGDFMIDLGMRLQSDELAAGDENSRTGKSEAVELAS